MLNYFFRDLKENNWIKKINQFFYSNYYIILINILMLIAYFFSLEIFIYYIYMVLGFYIMLFCDDMLPTVPMFCTGYMTIAKKNTPIKNPDSLLYTKSFMINLIILGTITGIGLIIRLILSIKNRKNNNKPSLTIGFIVITICMMFGGIFTKYYSARSFFYGLLVGITLAFCYFYFFYTIDFKNTRKDYFAYTFMIIGLAVGIETLQSYIAFDWSGEFHRSEITTGWGIRNNIGGVICTCIGAPLYLGATKKHGFIYTIIAIIIYLLTILTQSRNAILVGGFLLVVGLIFVIIYTKEKERTFNILVCVVTLFILSAVMFIYKDKIAKIFIDLIDSGLESNGRLIQYKNGLKAFKEYPIIGTGFFDFDHGNNVFFDQNSFLAPRYHNTIIQFLASTGIIGMIAYLYHRYSTLKMFFKKCNIEKIFIAICFTAIVGNSLLDCQLFNFGPGLHYGTLLVFMECINLNEEKQQAESLNV